MSNAKAAILAVGTEITDGQITNRNSSWLSQRLIDFGIETTEHRATPDDRSAIMRALEDLSARNEIVFVTGGLGPTSDDFTREVVAEFLKLPLVFDDSSWAHVTARLQSRGVVIREAQKSQCYFPMGAKILVNSYGTANAFYNQVGGRHYFVLPGPPAEIAAIWQDHVESLLTSNFPPKVREKLFIFRCMGKGESEFAHITEQVFNGTGIRLGYRAHPPYVEIKVWVKEDEAVKAQPKLIELESQVRDWLVNRDGEDLAQDVLKWSKANSLRIYDRGSFGWLSVRLANEVQEMKLGAESLRLEVATDFQSLASPPETWTSGLAAGVVGLLLWADKTQFHVGISRGGVLETESFLPPFRLPITNERSRKYLVEMALKLFRDKVISAKTAGK